MKICRFKVNIQKDTLFLALMDKMAEWFRRWTVKPLCSAHVGSNSIFVVLLIDSMFKTIGNCSLDSAIRVQISEKTGILKTSATTFLKIKKKTKYLKNILQTVRCFGWLVSFFHITWKTANDIVENNDQMILAGFETGTF